LPKADEQQGRTDELKATVLDDALLARRERLPKAA
jgi:hypothetical protein